MILVDSNVLIDVLQRDPRWLRWSLEQLERAAEVADVAINVVVYAELAAGYGRASVLDSALARSAIAVLDVPRAAGFLAGHVFRDYRAMGGRKTGVLPEFLIGAHAAVLEVPLLTRDTRRYRRWFPGVELIAP